MLSVVRVLYCKKVKSNYERLTNRFFFVVMIKWLINLKNVD